MAKIKPPWTIFQVNNLKNRQNNKNKHSYICPLCSKKLEPMTYGWVCREHGLIKRGWAYDEDLKGLD